MTSIVYDYPSIAKLALGLKTEPLQSVTVSGTPIQGSVTDIGATCGTITISRGITNHGTVIVASPGWQYDPTTGCWKPSNALNP